jgi:trimeric autotransporter adhesin
MNSHRLASAAAAVLATCLALCAPAHAANVYVVNSTAPGTISQFSVAADGSLTPLSPASVATVASGAGATGIAVSPDGRNVLAGNFTAGNVVRFAVNADGTLSSAPVQTLTGVTSAQQVRYSPDGRSAYAPRASNPGFIAQFSVAADGTLTPKSPATVSGQVTPGPLVFNAAGTRAYSGQNALSGVSQFSVAADGTLSALSPAMVASGQSQGRVVALSPDGTSLYAPNAGSSSVSQYAVSPSDGTLTFVANVAAGGQPRGIAISADGTSVYVANSTNDATGNSISQYTRAADGTLTPKSPATVAAGATGTDAIVLSSDGYSAYATNQNTAFVSQFTVQADGTLTPKTPLLVTAAAGANQLVFSNGPQLPPSATTGGASGVTQTAAGLAGTVNPHGIQTSTTFEYGTSLSFGQISPVTSAGAGSADAPATASLTGLAAGTTYYYRLVATSSAGTQIGAVATFKTAAAQTAFSPLTDSDTQANGEVKAIVQSGDRTYIGGAFTRVGVPIGYGASLSPSSGAPDYSVAKPNGTVLAVVSDGAGGWYIGGLFTAVGDVPRSRLAHLLADGSVDPAFDPNMGSASLSASSSGVRALALSGTTLYAGGDFTRVGTGANMVTRNFVAAIDATTGAPTSFDAHLTTNSESQFVTALAVSGSKLWVAGTLYANPLYKNLLAVDKTSGAVDPISAQISVGPGYPYVLAPHDGKLYFGGPFTTVDGSARNNLAAIDEATGSLDTAFDPDPSSGVSGIVFSGGELYAGGNFTKVNSGTVARSGLAAFSLSDGAVDPTWDPNVRWGQFDSFTPIVTGIALSGTTLYISGSFDQLNGSVARSHLAAVDLATGAATSFDPYVDKPALAIAADGSRVYAGGYFSYAGRDSIASGVAALLPDGTLDPSFHSSVSSVGIDSLALGGGRLYVGSEFGMSSAGVNRKTLVALDPATGALVPSFNPDVDGSIYAIGASGSRLYAGGLITAVNGGTPRNGLASFDLTTGAADPAFAPNLDNRVSLLSLSGGKLYAAGRFTTVNGTPRAGLASLDAASGAVDTSFDPTVGGDVRSLAASGSAVYLGGEFGSVNGVARGKLAAVDATTGATTAFDPNLDFNASALAVSGGLVYASGPFSTVNGGMPHGHLAAFDAASGAVDPGLDENLNGGADAIAVSGSHLYAVGNFTEAGGKMHLRIARFSQPAPVPVTSAAGAIGDTVATVAGTVNAGGLPTTYAFEYGASLAFGSVTASGGVSGSAATPVTASLSGLATNTTYYYRVVATSSAGTVYGVARSFRTTGPGQAPVALTGASSAVAPASATVAAQVNPNGQQTAFTFEYGTSTSFGAISPVVALDDADALEPVSSTLAGLTAGTTYYYRVVASNASGTTLGAVGSFTTAGATAPPSATTGTASAVGASGATLSGTVDAHGSPTAFTFEYGPTNAFGAITAVDSAGAAAGAHGVSLPVTGLAPNTTYRFRLVATNANGTTAGSVGTFTTGSGA